MPDRDDRLPGEPEPRFSEGQEEKTDSAEKERIGNFASREASSEEIGPLGEPPAHDDLDRERTHRSPSAGTERPGSVAGDALGGTGRRGSADDQEDRPEQERHRRFSEGQEDEGETSEKERQGDFATGQREDDDDR